MKRFWVCLALLSMASAANAITTPVVVEPDDFTAGTVLNNVSPWVSLSIEVPDASGGLRPSSFDVTAAAGDSALFDASPTGDLVFAHENIPFLPPGRVLRGDFHGVTDSVTILFSPSSSLGGGQAGRLEAYDSSGNLLAFDQPPNLTANSSSVTIGVLSINRPASDIAFFRAYSPVGNFGRFDALSFATPVPEPGTAGLLALALAGACCRRARR